MVTKAKFLPGPGSDDDFEEVTFEDDVKTQTNYDKKVDDFASAMHDLGSSGEIIVKKQELTGKDPMQHVGYFEPDEFTFPQLIEHLRKEYGGGKYRIYLRVDGKNRGNQLVTIASPKSAELKTPQSGGELVGSLGVILNAIQAQNQAIMELAQQKQDPLASLDYIIKMREAFGMNAPQNHNAMGQLKESIELMDMLGVKINQKDDESDDTNFTVLFSKLSDIAEAAIKNPQPKENPTVKPPSMFNLFLGQLTRAAIKGSDPAPYASLIIDNVSPDKIRGFFANPEGLQQLLLLSPKLKDHQEWVVLLGEHVKALLGMESAVSSEYMDGEFSREPDDKDPQKPTAPVDT